MPFKSEKQRRFMFSKYPNIARRWTREMKRKNQPVVQPKKSHKA